MIALRNGGRNPEIRLPYNGHATDASGICGVSPCASTTKPQRCCDLVAFRSKFCSSCGKAASTTKKSVVKGCEIGFPNFEHDFASTQCQSGPFQVNGNQLSELNT